MSTWQGCHKKICFFFLKISQLMVNNTKKMEILRKIDILKKQQLLLGSPFAKLLRNFCGTKRKMFLSLRISFAKLKFCAILQFRTKIRNRLSCKSLDNFSHWLLSCIILYEIKKISEIWLKKIKNIIYTWLGKAFKGHLKLFNRIKILPSFTLSKSILLILVP